MLSISGNHFVLNGQPLRILSGALHYFRIPPEYWEDRLRKLRAMGLNTVETYVAWNLHEPKSGEFHFEGGMDLARFLRLAHSLGLRAIVRPGPYICSEWDFGGLPAWLLADARMRVRCAYPPYLAAVDRFFDALLPQLAPLQSTRGGPVIAFQVENEYGSYGNDKTYLRHLESRLRAAGIDSFLFTSDGPDDKMLQFGTLPHLFKTANFGTRAREAFVTLRKHQPDGPLMCAEFWNGWFDHWGESHHTRPPKDAAATLADILTYGDSVNLYMFHGGTNFGLTSGANEAPYPDYQADVTSYDYDSPLDEAGDLTPKFFAFREVLGRFTELPDEPLPEPAPKLAPASIMMTESAGLLAELPALVPAIHSPTPEPMEFLGCDTALILYRTHVNASDSQARLTVRGLHDRAQVFVDGDFAGLLSREHHQETLEIDLPEGGAQLDILVENMGRVNYGPNLHDRKGITDGVLLGQQLLFDWEIYPLPMSGLAQLPFTPISAALRTEIGPSVFRGTFEVTQPLDTYLALPGWTKGLVWINGVCLGRYWQRGPQQTLFIPAPYLRAGQNELLVLELHGCSAPQVELVEHSRLG